MEPTIFTCASHFLRTYFSLALSSGALVCALTCTEIGWEKNGEDKIREQRTKLNNLVREHVKKTKGMYLADLAKDFKSFNKKRFEDVIYYNCNKTDYIIRNYRDFRNVNNK